MTAPMSSRRRSARWPGRLGRSRWQWVRRRPRDSPWKPENVRGASAEGYKGYTTSPMYRLPRRVVCAGHGGSVGEAPTRVRSTDSKSSAQHGMDVGLEDKIGRAACGERGCRYV